MQDFDITLAPGEVRVLNVQADYIYYRAGSAGGADAAIEFSRRSGGESVFLYPGQSYRLPPGAALGSEWALRNRKGEAKIIGQVLMGEGGFQDNRISGAVEVIDGGRNRTMANQAFESSSYCNSGAGFVPCVQVYNPANSGRRQIIKRVSVASNAAGHIGVKVTQTAVATFDKKMASKLSGGVPAVAEWRYEARAAIPNDPGFASIVVPASVSTDRLYQEPIVVLPGWGLFFYAQTVGADITAGVELVEELL